jgi:hypothetical protein
MSAIITRPLETALYLALGGCVLEIASAAFTGKESAVTAAAQTAQNLAAVLPIVSAVAIKFFTSEAILVAKVSAGAGLGVLGICVCVLTLLPFLPLFMPSTPTQRDPHGVQLGIAKLANNLYNSFCKALIVVTVFATADAAVGLGISTLTGVAFVVSQLKG